MDRQHAMDFMEARALLRLANRLHATHDPMSRKRGLLAGLCELVEASAGSCVVTHHDPATRKWTVVSDIQYSTTQTPPNATPPAEHDGDGHPDADAKSAKASDTAASNGRSFDSILHIPQSTVLATVQLHRDPLVGKRFLPRQRAMVELFHAEMSWIYHADVLLTSPDALALSPRSSNPRTPAGGPQRKGDRTATSAQPQHGPSLRQIDSQAFCRIQPK